MAEWTGYPMGHGDREEATPSAGHNWDCVEEHSHDGDGSYVGTVGMNSPDEDLYTIDAPTFDQSDFINSVTVHVVSCGAVTSTETAAPCLKENGADTVGTANELGTDYVDYSQTWTAPPSDPTRNWDYDDIVALQIGVRQTASTGPPVGFAKTTQVRVVVDFTPSIKPQVIIVTGDD